MKPSLKIHWIVWGLVGLGLVLVPILGCQIGAESLWFDSLGYLSVFIVQIRARASLWAIVLVASCGVWGGNFYLAQRWRQKDNVQINDRLAATDLGYKGQNDRDPVNLDLVNGSASARKQRIGLVPLLLIVTLLALGMSILIYHEITVVEDLWRTIGDRPRQLPSLPPTLGWTIVQEIMLDWWKAPQWFLLLGIMLIGLLTRYWFCLIFTGILLSLGLGFAFSQEWARILAAFNPTDFNYLDPLFRLDISFYVFEIPLLRLIRFWSLDIFAFTFLGVLLLYLLANRSLAQGYFLGFSSLQKRHLAALAAFFFLALAYGYGLACFALLYSLRGITYGASYVDTHVQLPANLIVMGGAIVLAMGCFSGAFFPKLLEPLRLGKGDHPWQGSVLRLSVIAFCGFSLIAEQLVPAVVQRLGVEPNELARERPYIARTIHATRAAFGLSPIEARTFNPGGSLTMADVEANATTLSNIRLWDRRPLLETNRQLQQIRLYYSFPDADIDRYTLFDPDGTSFKQQVLVAARELDYNAVPPEAQTWVNEHLVYTHGYGFTLSPVNTIGDGGLPAYFIKDIGGVTSGNTALNITSDTVRSSIPVGNPRIYFGGLTDTYIMTSTQVQELDYPSGNENVYTVYDGTGGIALDTVARRWLFAVYLRDWQMLLTRNFTPQTRLLFRRSVKDRIQAIAPFLNYDSDPYFVIANTELDQLDQPIIETNLADESENQNYLYWIIDAYTTTELYPYSDPGEHPYNYIRNSVKVVMDAYNGTVTFYIADQKDPLIQTWAKIFPKLFRPLAEMPIALQSHVRYPSHLFNVQSERLLTYHMTDPQVFYNREDQWQIPQEIYGGEEKLIESYYLITRLPTEETEEFILLTPFTPVSRSNLVAWLAGRSDGNSYGRLLLYQFPKQRLIYGPEQIEARINQDPVISQQISLWNRQGSKAVQGNLLVIPLEESLLYVEPIYLEAEKNSLPTLVRVIIAYENRIVMAETLDKALKKLLEPEPEASPTLLPDTIVRPIEEN